MEGKHISRRTFLAGVGTLVVGFHLAPLLEQGVAQAASATDTTGRLGVDAWLVVNRDGMITIYSGKVELGTGVQTALTQIVVEELYVRMEQVRYVQGDTALTPNQGYTAGSKTIQNQGPLLRRAAATAFRKLLDLAAEQLGVPVTELRAQDGTIGVGQNLDPARSYGDLIGQQTLQLTSDSLVSLKNPDNYQVVGRSVPRVELPEKFTARFTYVQDMVVPNMVHGRVVRPSGRNARLVSVDLSSVESIPGFLTVVKQGNFVGVVATTEWAAIQAAKSLEVEWQQGSSLLDQKSLPQELQNPANIYQADDRQVDIGNVDTALASAARRLRATYFTPVQAHSAMAPSCAVADVRGDQAIVWSSTQGVYPLRGALAELLGLPTTTVRVIYIESSGCYGHNGADDVAADAALLSKAVGRPVRVQWMRQDEHGWEPLSPAMLHQMEGGLDGSGSVVAWKHTVFTPTHSTRPGSRAGNLLAGQAIGFLPPPLPNSPRNNGTRNGPVNYRFANDRYVANHIKFFKTADGTSSPAAPLTYTLLRPSALRTLGGFSNTFANESFIDELAAAGGVDPLTFRLRYLDDPRAVAVLEAMAKQAGWERSLPPSSGSVRWGRGIAFLRYETKEAYVAVYAEVAVDTSTGGIIVTRVVVAHDCGQIVNPDGVRNQIEGNVIQGVSRALKEEVRFDEKGVTSLLWHKSGYAVINFTEVPAVEIVLLDHPSEPSWGAGEPAIGGVPAAIGNAVFNAIGARLRTLPFTPARVKEALAAT